MKSHGLAPAPERTLRFEDVASTTSRSPSPASAMSSSGPDGLPPRRPLTRRRGWSVPESEAFSATGFLSSYLPTGYALPSLQALDLGIPNMPAHLTYSSLRNSLIVHVEELERRLASYYSAVGSGPTSTTLENVALDARHRSEEREETPDAGGDAQPGASDAAAATTTAAPAVDDDASPDVSTGGQHGRSSSTSSLPASLAPEHLLSLISNLREDISTHLPRLPSMATAHMPPVREPLENFLAGLPARLQHVHAALPSMPRSASFTGKIADLSVHPGSPLGMGAQQILALLDSILPEVSDKAAEDPNLGLGGFPVFPNRTPRRHPAFERVLLTERRARERREAGESSGEDEVVLKVVEQRAPTVEDALRKAKASKGGLIEYDDLPPLWQNNEFIVKGYRFIPIQEWPQLLQSLLCLHNESVNIHSHLVSAVLVLSSIPFFVYASPFVPAAGQAAPSAMDSVILCSFLLAAFKCLFCSSLWHLFAGCATKKYFITFACVDYLGIAWLIAASVNAFVYFAFYCQPTSLFFYTALNLGVAVAGSTLPFMSWFNERHNKGWRIAFFLSMAGSAVGPLTQLSYQKGLAAAGQFAKPLAPMMLSYLFGLAFYAEHYPERRWPGRFDHFGASHQIWHFSIVAAIGFNFFAILELFQTKDTCAPPPEPALVNVVLMAVASTWEALLGLRP